MAYIGNTIRAADDYRLIDDIKSGFNGSQTTFALQVAGSAPVPFPKSPQQVLISVGGVIQRPDPTGAEGFNLVGTNIVFSSAPDSNANFFGIIYATADYLNAGGTFPAGSTGAPSVSFIGDEDSGLYRKGSGSIGFVSNSTEIGNFDSNGITISSGNLIITDSIIHNGDTDTKIRFPQGNTISAETNGNEVLRLDSSARILIGKTSNRQTRLGTNSFSPNIQLEDESIGAVSFARISDNNAPPRFILQKARGTIASPTTVQNDDLTGQILFSGFDGSNFCNSAQIRSEVDGTPGTNDMPGNLLFMTTSDGSTTTVERMRISSAGRIGIGKNAPVATVDVQSSDQTLAHFTSTDDGANLDLSDDDTTTRIRSVDGFLNIYADFNNNIANSAIRFFVDTTERVRITSDGRVGIGTTAPLQELSVVGDILAGSSGAHVLINDTGSIEIKGTTPFIDFSTDSGEDFDCRIIQNSDGLVFFTGGSGSAAESFRATSSSRVLIGDNVERAAANLNAQLQIGGTTAAGSCIQIRRNSADTGGANLLFAKNRGAASSNTVVQTGDQIGIIRFCANDGTDLANQSAAIEARVDGTASGNDTPGRLVFHTTADGSGSITERMRITSAGNVGIATNIPEQTLHVHGDALIEDTVGNHLTVRSTVSNGNDANIRFEKARGAGTPAIVQNGDDVGDILWRGYDGDSYETGASILGEVEGTPADGDMPMRLTFKTRSAGATSVQGRLRISADGTVSLLNNSNMEFPDKLIHDGDTDTCIRFPAVDTVSVETAGSEALRIRDNQKVLIGTTVGITGCLIHIAGNIAQSNTDTGTGATVKTFVLSRAYTMSTSATNILTFDNWGTSSFEITVFRRDNTNPAGAQLSKVYLAFHGSGTNITQASLAQDDKVIRGSIHNITYSITENNNTATLVATGDNTGGEDQDLTFYILGRGNAAGNVLVA